MFVPQKSIFEHLSGSLVAALFSLMVALVMLVLSIGGLFFSMRAMRDRQTGKAFHQRIEQEEKSRLSADAIKTQDSSQLNSDEALRNAEIGKSGTGRPLPDRAAINQVIEEQKQLSARLSGLESAMRNDPVPASAVPLLKKDVESLQEREKLDSSAIRNEDDRLDGFAEWYSALIVGTIVSVISLGATIIGIAFKYRKDSLQAGVSPNDFT
jgi:hypothetical protein